MRQAAAIDDNRATMPGHRLLDAAPYGPQTLSVLFKAFDDAWAEIKSEVGELPDRAEAARMSLATIILDVAKSGITTDADQLKNVALRAFRAARRRTSN